MSQIAKQYGETAAVVETDKPAFFRDILKAIMKTGDKVDFTVDLEGITVEHMDPSHVCLIQVFIPSDFFFYYKVFKQVKIALDVDNLIRVVFRRGKMKDVYLKAAIQEDRIIFDIIRGSQKTRKTLVVMEPFEETFPPVNLVYNSRVRIVTKTLKGILVDCKTIKSAHVLINIEPDKVLFTCEDEENGYLAESMFEKYAEDIFDLESDGSQKAIFDVDLLLDLVKALAPISETVALEISNDLPIRITAELPVYGVSLVYYLSACVDFSETQVPEEETALEIPAGLDPVDPEEDQVLEVIPDPQEDPDPIVVEVTASAAPDPEEVDYSELKEVLIRFYLDNPAAYERPSLEQLKSYL